MIYLKKFRHKKLVISFSALGLTFIMDPLISLIKSAGNSLLRSQSHPFKSLDRLLGLLLSCLSFKFNIGYIDFENECLDQENSIIQVNKLEIYY